MGRKCEMTSDEMKRLHPNWFTATDYKWIEEQRPVKVDQSNWNRLDDSNRRMMSNWSDNDFTREF